MTFKRGNAFSVIAKPVGSNCNMNCRYCYYLEKGKFSSNEKQTRMKMSLLEKLIKQTINSNPGPVVSFVWHGGEPTLAGLDFYKQAVLFQKKYLRPGMEVWNNLQTNGMLINEQWCRFLKENRFDVGLSIDGDMITHDANRIDKGGNPTHAKVIKAAELLSEYGIKADLLCTVNAQTLKDPLGVYDALRKLDTGWIQFIPVIVVDEMGNVDPISVTPEGYGEFLIKVFDEWVRHDLGRLDVQLFAEMAKIKAGGNAGVCYLAKTCGRVLVAEEDGSIYACDHFVDGEHRLGNLAGGDIGEFANSSFQTKFGLDKRDKLTGECKKCPYLSYCSGGCPKDRFSKSIDGEEGQYFLCKGLKMFFEHADPILRQIMRLSRRGLSSDKIMEELNK